jgi:hypothetical protein
MKKKTNIKSEDFEKELEYTGEGLKLYSIKYNNQTLEGVEPVGESILLLPFDLTPHGSVKNVYLERFYNFVKDESQYSVISEKIDPDEDDTALDTVKRAILSALGVIESKIKIDDIYLLGDLILNRGMNEKVRVYAMNVTALATSPKGFTPKLHEEKPNATLEAIKFGEVLNGNVKEALTLSSSMLLLSYFS